MAESPSPFEAPDYGLSASRCAGARELGRDPVAAGKFLRYERIRYRDPAGRERLWETAERAIGRDAVVVVARIMPDDEWILVRQYRPPARGPVLEFPAGLLEEGEDPAVGAARELLEETGYRGTLRVLHPPAFNTPGLSGETVYLAQMEVDGRLRENRNPEPRPDDGEFIDVLRVPARDAAGFIAGRLAAGERFDSKVFAYLLGWSRA